MESSAFGPSTKLSAKSFSNDRHFVVAVDSSTPFAQGGSAKLFKGKIIGNDDHNCAVVALKYFRINLDNSEEQMMRRELRAAQQVEHRYILPYMGAAAFHLTMILISPYMKNGNLLQYLERDPIQDWRPMLFQVATAVKFLHSDCNMVHGDLKCENILVSDDGKALLSDFGLCTYIDKTEKHTATATELRGQNTFRYAAPELLFGQGVHGKPTSKTVETDVYAFGMTIIQACTRRHPWPDCTHHQVVMKMDKREEHPRPTDSYVRHFSNLWWSLVLDCCSYTPAARPTMERVLCRLGPFDLDVTTASSCNSSPQSLIEGAASLSIPPTGAMLSDATCTAKSRYPGISHIPAEERTRAISVHALDQGSPVLGHRYGIYNTLEDRVTVASRGTLRTGTASEAGTPTSEFVPADPSPESTSTEIATSHASIDEFSGPSESHDKLIPLPTNTNDRESVRGARDEGQPCQSEEDGQWVGVLSFQQHNSAYSGVIQRPGYREMDAFLLRAVREAEKELSDVPTARRDWMAVLRAFQMCPLLVASPESVIDRCDELTVRPGNKFNIQTGHPPVVEQVRRWFTRFIQDVDLDLARREVDLEAIYDIVAHASRIFNGNMFYKRERRQRTLVDIGVLRYPDIRQPYIKVYRIELVAYYESKIMMARANDKNRILAQFNMRQYQLHEES